MVDFDPWSPMMGHGIRGYLPIGKTAWKCNPFTLKERYHYFLIFSTIQWADSPTFHDPSLGKWAALPREMIQLWTPEFHRVLAEKIQTIQKLAKFSFLNESVSYMYFRTSLPLSPRVFDLSTIMHFCQKCTTTKQSNHWHAIIWILNLKINIFCALCKKNPWNLLRQNQPNMVQDYLFIEYRMLVLSQCLNVAIYGSWMHLFPFPGWEIQSLFSCRHFFHGGWM